VTSANGIPDPSQPLPAGEEKVRAVRSIFDTIAPRYDLVNRILTFRLDVRWRKDTVRRLALPNNSSVLDLACGTGDLCRDLETAGHRPVGIDLSWGMLASARTKAPLVHADALQLPVADQSVDGATCGFALRNLTALEPFLVELARVLRPGGRIALLEVDSPKNPLLRFGHSIYFGRVVPLVGGILSNRNAYRYLPRSAVYLPPEDDLLNAITAAKFGDVAKSRCSGGIAQILTATRI